MKEFQRIWYWWLLPVVITYIFLSPVKKNGFVNLDDSIYVINNKSLPDTKYKIKDFFSLNSTVGGNYHPLTMLTLAYDYSVAGYKAEQYHSTNLIFHVLNTFLVFLLVYLVLYKNKIAAALVSIIFGMHPMHIESVAWISERKDVLYVFFFLLSIIVYYQFKEKNKVWLYLLSLFLFICSILSKGMAVSLPVVLLIIDWYKGEKIYTKLLLDKIPFFLVALGFGILIYNAQKDTNAINQEHLFNVYENLCNSCYSVLIYVINFIYPHNQSPFIVFQELYVNKITYPFYMHFTPLIFIVGLVLVYLRRRDKVMLFGLAFFYATIFLVSQIIPMGLTIVSERYTYLSYVGLAFPLGYYISQINEKNGNYFKYKTAANTAVLIWFLWLSYTGFQRIGIWKDSDTLWTDAINKLDGPAVYPYQSRAAYLADKKGIDKDKKNVVSTREDFARAIEDMKVVVSIAHEEKFISDLAVIYGLAGEYELSVKTLDQLIKLNPKNKKNYFDKVVGLGRIGKYQEVFETYCAALKYLPNDTTILRERASISLNLLYLDTAIKDCNFLIKTNPTNYLYYLYRGSAYCGQKKYTEAFKDLDYSISLNPNDGLAYNNKSILYYNTGDKLKAKEMIEKAVSLGYQVSPDYLKLLQ